MSTAQQYTGTIARYELVTELATDFDYSHRYSNPLASHHIARYNVELVLEDGSKVWFHTPAIKYTTIGIGGFMGKSREITWRNTPRCIPRVYSL